MTSTALYGLYFFLVLLAGGMYLVMPADRPADASRRYAAAGMLIAAAGLAGVGVYLVRWLGTGYEGRVFFAIFSLLAIVAAIRVVTHRRPVYSAVYFVLVMLAVTGLCILAAAEFLAAALVIVYGGAILVTYVFVIMLAQQAGEAAYDTRAREPFAAVVMGFALLAATTQAMVTADPIARHAAESARLAHRLALAESVRAADAAPPPVPMDPAALNGEIGNVRAVGRVLVGDYMVAVQVAGILMLVAMAGAIAIARKRIDAADRTPYEESQAEVVRGEPAGRHVVPFARVKKVVHR